MLQNYLKKSTYHIRVSIENRTRNRHTERSAHWLLDYQGSSQYTFFFTMVLLHELILLFLWNTITFKTNISFKTQTKKFNKIWILWKSLPLIKCDDCLILYRFVLLLLLLIYFFFCLRHFILLVTQCLFF